MVKKLVLAGVKQRQIKTFLLQNTDALFIDSDLSNCISRAKQDLANGQSHMVALLQHLDSQGFWSRHLIDYILRMPLLDIVSVDATGSTFCIAFAYLSGEEEEDFG
ncbi:MULE transposase domain protein [Fusarium beomiforme]|uniref:MULE transposase domain protein n=1 Tax=Fusarium beomiforme TaxID=44412 RepID=A0A9P5ADH3_9HYPO|nr:MULE transposase domain protein [Fusarium beomiforme]